jgi:hypothetical protein
MPDAQSPRTPTAPGDSPFDEERLIPKWLSNLQPPRRAEAVAGLCNFVVRRIGTLAELVDRTAAAPAALKRREEAGLAADVELTVFGHRADPAGTREFHQRSAAAVRELVRDSIRVLVRESGVAKPGPAAAAGPGGPPPSVTRLMWWYEFHRAAGALPGGPLVVHDLMFYSGLDEARAAAVLGVSAAAVARDREEAVGQLRPLFDKARGKA